MTDVTAAEVAESLAARGGEMLHYLVGDPDNGPFAELRGNLPKDEPARYFAALAKAMGQSAGG